MNFLYAKETKDKNFESFKSALLKGDIAGVRDTLNKEYFERPMDNDNKRPIHVACERGFIDIVKLLIDKNVEINYETDYDWRPIHFAFENGNIDIVKLLIEKNVDIECETLRKKRPIHFACESGNINIVKLLIEKNADIECETNWEWRPIHIACKSRNIDIVKLLIEKNADIECDTNEKKRPIHFACESGNIDIVKLLIEENADIECETIWEWRPIHFAFESRNIDIVKLLIEKNVDIECETNWKERPIHTAREIGNIDIVKLLIEKNVDIEFKTLGKKRPIHIACKSGNIDIVKLLIEKNVDIECETLGEWRPIHFACESGNIDIVKLLIEKNVDIECETLRKKRPIHFACENGNIDIVKLLIEKNADIECQTNWKKRPIHFACENGNIEIVKLLIEKNANIECQTNWKERPIHIACLSRNIDIVKLLIEMNADIECETLRKKRPIHFACESGNIDIVKLLIEKNADIECETLRGETPLEIAQKKGHGSCVELLEKIIKVNECVRQNKVYEFTEMYNSFIINDRTNNIGLLVMKRAIGNNNNSHQIIKLMMERNIDDAEVTFLTNLLGVSEKRKTIALIKEFILYKCIRDHHAEGFHQYCSADTINGRHKIIGSSFLEIAVQHDSATFIERILKRSVYGEEYSKYSKQSLLHLAALSLQPDICKSLLEAKAMVNELNEEGNTCLLELLSNVDYLGRHNNKSIDDLIEVVKILIKFGADINVKTRAGQTVFQCASRFKNENLMVTLLMNQFGRINITQDHFQWSFSQHWSQYPQILINLLSKECLSTFITAEIIHSVLSDSHSPLIKSLFENANGNVQQSVIEDILMRAARNEDKDLFEYFLEKDLVKTKLFDNGETLLTNLLRDNNMSFCWSLIKSKYINYYVNIRNMNEQLPLQIAIEMDEINIVDALISDTNNIDNEDRNGETALIQLLKKISNCNDEGMKNRLFISIKSLIKNGGNIYLSTSQKKTAIDFCTVPSVKKEIEQVDRDHRIKERKSERNNKECPVCLDNELDCVFECGHTFCLVCSEELFKCPLCQREPTNPKRIYLN